LREGVFVSSVILNGVKNLNLERSFAPLRMTIFIEFVHESTVFRFYSDSSDNIKKSGFRPGLAL